MDPLTSADLNELRERWIVAVASGEWSLSMSRHRTAPCWFGENVPGIDGCEGKIEGAHWIKRQRVEKHVARNLLGLPDIVLSPKWVRRWKVFPAEYVEQGLEELFLAAWDPRNGIPLCVHHHARYDAREVDARDPLIVWRREVPAHVESFARDWGLETALEDRNPSIDGGI